MGSSMRGGRRGPVGPHSMDLRNRRDAVQHAETEDGMTARTNATLDGPRVRISCALKDGSPRSATRRAAVDKASWANGAADKFAGRTLDFVLRPLRRAVLRKQETGPRSYAQRGCWTGHRAGPPGSPAAARKTAPDAGRDHVRERARRRRDREPRGPRPPRGRGGRATERETTTTTANAHDEAPPHRSQGTRSVSGARPAARRRFEAEAKFKSKISAGARASSSEPSSPRARTDQREGESVEAALCRTFKRRSSLSAAR